MGASGFQLRADSPVACGKTDASVEPVDTTFIEFLERAGWVIFLDEYRDTPEHYEGLVLPQWIDKVADAWVVVPLLLQDQLLGFVVLRRSSTIRHLNWEDSDLLKTVGRQAAGYLALLDANEALAESRQFEAFNRLSSFVVHDLKNLVAQLSLVSANAEKHISNPAFVKDAMSTVENATSKMNRLLTQLRQGRLDETETRLVNMTKLLGKVVANRAAEQPVPKLELLTEGLIVRADPDRLGAVFEHVVQNAQEATPDDGSVKVRAYREDETVFVEVVDTGCGMDDTFVRSRLFRPFDTTKGNAGMGIGAYEAREFVSRRGGSLEVESALDEGTTFRFRLPSEFGEDVIDSSELQVMH